MTRDGPPPEADDLTTLHSERDWRPLGEMFVAAGLITETELDDALAQQSQTQERLGKVLVSNGFVTESDLRGTLVEELGRELEKEGDQQRQLRPQEPRPNDSRTLDAPLPEAPTDPVGTTSAPPTDSSSQPDETALSALHRQIHELRSALAARSAAREAAEQSARRSLSMQLADVESALAAERAAHETTKDELAHAREAARAQVGELRAALVRLRQALSDVAGSTAWFEYWSGATRPAPRQPEHAPPPTD
jgi:hypothetical protein